MALPSQAAYERWLYGLAEAYPQIAQATLRLYSTSALTAVVEGSLHFHNGLELRVLEVLDFKYQRFRRYSYTVYAHGEKICWYDPQPHPENSDLAATFPHHRHEPPDIKHNRQPAPGLSFDAPNLPQVIADCLALGEEGRGG